MTTIRTSACLVGMLAIAMFVILSMSITNNMDHANAKHIEAPSIRARHRDRLCEGKELWYSPIRGTVLILCGIPDSYKWGGLIYRVTENNGERILGKNEAYECTVFAAPRYYWDDVITKDKYLPLGQFPSLSRILREMWGW